MTDPFVSGDPFAKPPGHDRDPFGSEGSTSQYEPVWLRTRTGIDFIDVFVGERPGTEDAHELVFLIQTGSLFSVGVCSSKTTEGGRWLHEDQTLDAVRALAERYAQANSVDAGQNADWRKVPASAGQLGLISRIGLSNGATPTAMTKGDASDLLNQHFGSKVLDPTFGRF